MTSEICVMNRLAVVLAADSATTVSHPTDRGTEQRYFKGANKIFQLSHHHPVGLMIYDSANILSVPWEIVVKEFRNELGDKSFNSLTDYADEFFSFLAGNSRLFPEKIEKQRFLEAARLNSIKILMDQDEEIPKEEREAAANEALRAVVNSAREKPLANGLSNDLLSETIARCSEELIDMNSDWIERLGLIGPTDLAALAEYGIAEVFRDPGSELGTTGLVFAGFGDHDIFPVMARYLSQGIVVGHHVAAQMERIEIDHDRPASLNAFAQTSMSDTFSLGVSFDIYSSMLGAVRSGLRQFAEDLLAECGLNGERPERLEEIVESARKVISERVLEEAQEEHAMPMRRVLSVLPIDEMAELAETLINLQSLKEKVTKPSETVGGPIDVAVITRNEGLVWLRRKHFFDAAINSRFMHRQKSLYQ
ncbi:hypothetical protein ACSHT0_15355 [Tepidicaulis sp. LMO-SS28]|uniref:hypothetical protein n=1 Tax=Tepidicaulis sp. LMO-SS28 TaxID=3447455 RepID=UPI003EE07900